MTSSYNIPAKYKIYIGRIFILRKHKIIPASIEKKFGNRIFYESRKTFGEAVCILDETNSKAQVTTLSGTVLWIPKYYLHKEITTQNLNDSITSGQINELSSEILSCDLSDNNKMKLLQILRILEQSF